MASGEPTYDERSRAARQFRFEARIQPGVGAAATEAAAEELAALDLDRVPDEEGVVRLLLTPDELAAVVESGFEVVVNAVLPVRALADSMVLDDESAAAWFDDQVRGIQRDEEA